MKTNKIHLSKQVTAKDIITYFHIFDVNLRDHAEYCIKSGMGRLVLYNHHPGYYSCWIDPKDNKYWYLAQRQTRKKRVKKRIWFEWHNS